MAAGCSVTHASDPRRIFECPISCEPIRYGLTCGCGHTFEREEIITVQREADKRHIPALCPTCRQPIVSMTPNLLGNEARVAVDGLLSELDTEKKTSAVALAQIKELSEKLKSKRKEHAVYVAEVQQYTDEVTVDFADQERQINEVRTENNLMKDVINSQKDTITRLIADNAQLARDNRSLSKRVRYDKDVKKIDNSIGFFVRIYFSLFPEDEKIHYKKELSKLAGKRGEEPYYGDYE